ncbi:hypothetical protein F2A38_10640 [Pseudomonas chlororaphis]|uniref:Uncharacterized protein n=1 Tax=Pseudomonas chlororaphis TaxID=587753 RepID=A0AB34C6S9_9PSED|nr:hypothetical protein [Pseudomonas chlororaphis]KAA5842656.1 hypothetical protein F2A38_10640 [Pseudomonas chlororaphis]
MDTFENLSFFRGVSAKYAVDRPQILTPRADRRPKDSPKAFHKIADQWFERNFGIPYRSKGLFLTSQLVSASTYAATVDHVMRIIPLSDYRYCWSPKVKDLIFSAQRLATSSPQEIENHLDSLSYSETDLQAAYDMGNEVMLYCENYIAIPISLVTPPPEAKPQSIIITK